MKFDTIFRLALAFLPTPLLSLIYRHRPKFRGAVIDVHAYAVGRVANTVRVPGLLPTIEQSRIDASRNVKLLDAKGPSLARIEDLTLETSRGPLAARLYSDTNDVDDLQCAMVFFHGGGFVQGDLDSHHETCTKLAKWSGGTIVAVDYSLAPEHPFPAGADDAVAAFAYVVEHAKHLGINPKKVGVGGDSAGGCLAAVVCHQISTHACPAPCLQMLIYPITDGHLDTPSIHGLADGFVIPRDRILWYREMYRDQFNDFDDPKFSPLKADDFSGQPPALVVTGGFDPLLDDGRFYVEKLKAAGVNTRHDHYPGQIHGFVSLTKVIPEGDKALKTIADWMQQTWTADNGA